MLSQEQIDHFNTQGFLAVENLLSDDLLQRIHAEYEAKMDQLYKDWVSQKKVPAPTPEMNFWDKLERQQSSRPSYFRSFPFNITTHLNQKIN